MFSSENVWMTEPANHLLRISAIKLIFAIFWNFDGVGQLISNKALSSALQESVDIILGGRNLDRLCIGDISHKN
jgi:hypothetical protein